MHRLAQSSVYLDSVLSKVLVRNGLEWRMAFVVELCGWKPSLAVIASTVGIEELLKSHCLLFWITYERRNEELRSQRTPLNKSSIALPGFRFFFFSDPCFQEEMAWRFRFDGEDRRFS